MAIRSAPGLRVPIVLLALVAVFALNFNVTLPGGRYYPGLLARAVTQSERPRTFCVAAPVVGGIEGYVKSSRAVVIRRAQAKGRYEQLPDVRLVSGPRRVQRLGAGAPQLLVRVRPRRGSRRSQ
ncbi:hypothetical protein AB0K09_12930 [Streptomyces sp. NPDC049577]|uniref:hypothetical protein n=1 Tax=Streptomyces sp. NPDC049577 TaxID=3155153 RepID=UPI0034313EAF